MSFWDRFKKIKKKNPKRCRFMSQRDQKKKKKKRKRKKKGKKTYLLEGASVESFVTQVRCAPLTPSLHLREGALPRLKRGAMTVPCVRLRLGAP